MPCQVGQSSMQGALLSLMSYCYPVAYPVSSDAAAMMPNLCLVLGCLAFGPGLIHIQPSYLLKGSAMHQHILGHTFVCADLLLSKANQMMATATH